MMIAKDNPNTMRFSKCVINNRLITFKPQIVFELKYLANGRITVTNDDPFGIMIENIASLKLVRHEIDAQIDSLWNEYVECPVTHLTKDAIEVRNKLKNRVKQDDSL